MFYLEVDPLFAHELKYKLTLINSFGPDGDGGSQFSSQSSVGEAGYSKDMGAYLDSLTPDELLELGEDFDISGLSRSDLGTLNPLDDGGGLAYTPEQLKTLSRYQNIEGADFVTDNSAGKLRYTDPGEGYDDKGNPTQDTAPLWATRNKDKELYRYNNAGDLVEGHTNEPPSKLMRFINDASPYVIGAVGLGGLAAGAGAFGAGAGAAGGGAGAAGGADIAGLAAAEAATTGGAVGGGAYAGSVAAEVYATQAAAEMASNAAIYNGTNAATQAEVSKIAATGFSNLTSSQTALLKKLGPTVVKAMIGHISGSGSSGTGSGAIGWQQRATDNALAMSKRMYDESSSNLQPYMDVGLKSFKNLDNYVNRGGGYNAMQDRDNMARRLAGMPATQSTQRLQPRPNPGTNAMAPGSAQPTSQQPGGMNTVIPPTADYGDSPISWQQRATDESLAMQERMYQESKANLNPYMDIGLRNFQTLGDYVNNPQGGMALRQQEQDNMMRRMAGMPNALRR